MLVSISVYSGHEGFRDQTSLASVLTERWYMAPGVQRIEIRQKGVRGTLFIPPGSTAVTSYLPLCLIVGAAEFFSFRDKL